MDIENIFVNSSSEMVALRIRDEEGSFIIKSSSLHNPVIFYGLLESGWKFVKKPDGFEKGSVSIKDLPALKIEDQHFSEQELQDIEDYDVEKLTSSELMQNLTESTIKTGEKVFKTGKYVIETRDEFLEFLNKIGKSKSEQDLVTLYAPINSFVHPSALFTVEEYFSPANLKYKEILEKRRNLHFIHFYYLQKQLVESGLREDFDAFQLVDFYFGWGICGINMSVTQTDIAREYTPLSDLNKSVSDNRYLSFLTGYANGLGVCFSNKPEKVRPSKGELGLNEVVKYLNGPGMESKDIVPLEVQYPTTEERRTIIGPDIFVEYSTALIRISYKNKTYSMRTLSVYNPIDRKKLLNYDYWNLISSDKFFEDIRTRLICSHIQKRVSVKSDATSIGVLASLGVSYANAFRFITGKMDMLTVWKDEFGEEAMIGVNVNFLIEKYLQGQLEDTHFLYSAISEYVTSVLDGTINIDNIDTGIIMDSTEDKDLYHVIVAARLYLGLSWDKIFEAAEGVSIENNLLVLEGNDKRIQFIVQPRDYHKKAKALDINKYVKDRTKSVQFVTRVTTVLRESVPDGYNPRHVAVVMDVIPLQNRKSGNAYTSDMVTDRNMENILKGYTRTMKTMIQDNMGAEAYRYVDYAETWIVQSLFEMAEKGQVSALTKYAPDAMLLVSDTDSKYIASKIYKQVESLLSLTDNILDPVGRFSIVNVNGNFTPNFFVPFEGVSVPTLPFLMSYKNTAYFNPAQRKTLLERGWIPHPNHQGFCFLYKGNRVVPDFKVLPDATTVKTSGNLDAYEKLLAENIEAYNSNPVGMFEMPEDTIYTLYPVLTDVLESDIIVNPEEMSTDPTYCQGRNYSITREDIMHRSSFARRILDNNTTAIEEKAKAERGFFFEYEDLKEIQNLQDTKLLFSFNENQIPVAIVKSKSEIIFMDGFVLNVADIASVDCSKYACEKVTKNMYILMDVCGSKYTVRI